jgi:hypothetical protein
MIKLKDTIESTESRNIKNNTELKILGHRNILAKFNR